MLSSIMKVLFKRSKDKPSQDISTSTFIPQRDLPGRSARWPDTRVSIRTTIGPFHIHGFPKHTRSEGFLWMRNPNTAYKQYILGQDWQTRLQERERNGSSEQYILRPADDQEDEAQHCLRMRRCGALVVYNEMDIIERCTASPIDFQPAERQVFGWPSRGGVWILRLPKSSRDCTSGEDAFRVELAVLRDPKLLDLVQCLGTWIAEAKNMDEMCDILSEHGAVYYEDPKDCPEVTELNLL